MDLKHLIRKSITVCLFILSYLSISPLANAQPAFSNKHLAELMEQLSAYNIPAEFVGESYVSAFSDKKPLIVQQSKPGIIDHIGLKLFDRELIDKHPSPLYFFVERYLLELLMSENNAALQSRLKQERVKLTSEYYPKAPLLEGIHQIIDGFSTNHSILINCNNQRYSMVATDGKKEVFSLEFPVRYELISGESKLEAESSVYPRLLLHRYAPSPAVNATDLSTYKDSLYVCNEEYYMDENILSNSYYRKTGDGTFTPLFDKKFLSESVYNLFNAPHEKDIQLEVTQKMYGNKTNTFTVAMPIMMDFMRSQRCHIYSGIRKMGKEKIEGIVLAVNSELGYQHIWLFTLDTDIFTASGEQTIRASMYSYIPIHNISTIFGN